MKFKGKYFIIFAVLLIAMMSVAVAADVNDSNTDSATTPIVTQQSTNNVDTQTITTESNEINTQNVTKVTKEIKNEESTRSTTHNVNNDNFDDYVTASGLTSLVNGNDTLNFTSDVTRTTSSYIINKAININGNGFTLDLNTTMGYGDESNPTYIEFNNQANNSNITNLKFHNTQVFTTSASNIVFDNINVTVDNQGVGKGTGYFAMRTGVSNITVKNSYFHAVNNTGCSAVVITFGENCTIDNNTIIGQGTVGNLVYLNQFGQTGNGITKNKNNTISNNTIIGPETAIDICIAIVVGGPHNHIINNTINYTGKGIIGNWAGTYDPATNTTNDYYNDTYLGNGYINNTINNASFTGAQGSLVAGNNFTGIVTIAKDSKVKDNRFYNTVTINQNSNVTDNQFNSTATIKKYINVKNNIFNSTVNIGDYSNATNNQFNGTVTITKYNNVKNNIFNSTVNIGDYSNATNNQFNGTVTITKYNNVKNNIFNNTVTIGEYSNVTNNTFKNSVTIGIYANINDNTFTTPITINEYSNVTNNIFQSDVTLNNNINFKNNNAENSTVYVIGADCDLYGNTIDTLDVASTATNTRVCRNNDFASDPTGSTENIIWYYPTNNSILNKKYVTSIKADDGATEETFVDVTEENFSTIFATGYSNGVLNFNNKFFKANPHDVYYNLYYVPPELKSITVVLSNPTYNYEVKLNGMNNFTLNNVYLGMGGPKITLSNMTLIYDEEYYERGINSAERNPHINLNNFHDDDNSYILLDNININYTVPYNENRYLPLIQIPQNTEPHITIKDCSINATVPATEMTDLIYVIGTNATLIHNSINVQESFSVVDDASIVAIHTLDLSSTMPTHVANNTNIINNNITVNGESTLYGLKLDSNSNTITNNNITITTTGTATGVEIKGNDSTVTGNYIVANDKKGDEAVTVTGENNVVQDNTPVAPKIIDYYVSDADGSDDNDGSEKAPFKTIQAALDKTTEKDIFNIHVLEGTYKGAGNTNLTVPGDYTINFIGSGINKTVIDGEAQFTVPGEGSVWGGSGIWNTWSNTSGNWFMNITTGSGEFTITDFTVQNCWANSGSSIVATQPNIDNGATLSVSNVYFYRNHAGLGAAIRNKNGSTLYVDNCIFENNTKSSTTGNYGAAIYNNGTAVITNSQIVRNYARWGSVTNDKNITMINCTFEGNIAYDGGSGYKNGPSFAADTGITNFFMMYAVHNITSTIQNCTFQDNQQCDISNGRGDLLLEGCTFNHSTGVYMYPNTNRNIQYIPTQVIRNNTFVDMQPSTVFATTISSTTPSVGVRVMSGYDLTIENNTFDVGCTDYSYGVYLTANATVKDNILTDYIYVNGVNNTILNNTINTTKENTITLANAAKDTKIINNTLYSGFAAGDFSVKNVLPTTVLENNKPETGNYLINDDNYATYFDENGVLKTAMVTNGSLITFVENLTNKVFVFDNVKVAVDVNTTLYNATIVTQNNAQVLFNNLKIDNNGTDEDYVILLESEGNAIKNGNIHVVTDKPTQIIKIEEDGNLVTGTTINATVPAADVKWNSDYSIGNVPTAGIFIRSSNNNINNTKLYLYSTEAASGSSYPTVDGIDIQSKNIGEYVTGNQIRSTRINVTGGSYVYGLNIARAKETTTPLSYFDVTSTNYAAAIQLGDGDNNTISGYIYAKANDTAYGFYSTAMASGVTNNTNASKLYIQNIQAPNAVGVRLEGASNFQTGNATFTINGEKVTGIEVVPDYMGNKPDNIYIYALTMNLNGENDTSVMVTVKDSSNVLINRTNFKSTSGNGIVLDNTTDSAVTNNYINVANLVGGDAAVNSTLENTIFNNTPFIGVLTDDTYSQFFDENNTLYIDADIITLGGDLHNKTLIFNNHTKVINITNADDYTMYDSTIIIEGNGTYGDRYGFTVDGINFNNTNKPVFIDRFNGTGQKNVKFVNDNIYVTGDDIVAFDAFNNESYIYLDISDSNIIMDGQNVVAIDYAGYNRGQPVYVNDNNIAISATGKATAINAKDAATQFNNNNVVINAGTAVVANYINSSISYYAFDENVIDITATDAMVLNMTKGDTYTAYVSDNEIKVKSENPATLIDIEGPRTVYVQGNEIMLDATNGETPVISVDCPSSYVRNNYILAKDVRGNDAVEDTGITINNNGPGSVITDDTYTDFFDENCVLIPLFNNTDLTMSGEFTDNTVFIFDGVNVTITGDGTVKIYEGQIWTGNDATVAFDGLVFENSMDAVVFESAGNVLNNTVITINSEDEVHAISIMEDGNTIANTVVDVTAPAGDVQYNSDWSTKAPAPTGILVSSSNNVLDNVTVNFNAPTTTGSYPTVNGLHIGSVNGAISNNTVRDSKVTVKGTNYAYGINVGNAKDTTLENVEVNVESDYYADAIQLFDADGITMTGTANAKATTQAYGIYSTAMGTGASQNIDATGLDVTVEAADATGALFEGSSNIKVADATYTITGESAVAIDAHVDWMGNIPTNITITGLDVTIDTTGDANLLYFGKAADVTITDNHIEANAGSAININATPNASITDNYILVGEQLETGIFGNYAVITTEEDTVVENNTPSSKIVDDLNDKIKELEEQLAELTKAKETTISIDPLEGVQYGDEITISGTLVNEDSLALSNQNVTIKFNDEETTVTTRNGEFKYTTTAKIIGENTITATYAGSDKYNASEATATFEVSKANAYIDLTGIEAVKKGETITISGTLSDQNNNTLANKVVRLLVNNGRKTVKTNDMGEFSFDYTTTRVGNNTVTATFEENDYYLGNTVEKTFEVKALATVITIDPIDSVTKGSEVTITGTLTDENNNAIANAQVKIMVNGSPKTVKTDSEGRFTHTYTMGKLGENTITVSYAGSNNYVGADAETTVEVTKAKAVITLDDIESVTKGESATITGTLTDENDNAIANAQVKITINGSQKTLKTDENGVFTHTFKMTKEGTNNITAAFNGNNDYTEANTNSTVEVIKAQ